MKKIFEFPPQRSLCRQWGSSAGVVDNKMAQVRLSWAFSLLDFPLEAIEQLVRTVLGVGPGAHCRLAQNGLLDQAASIHTLKTW